MLRLWTNFLPMGCAVSLVSRSWVAARMREEPWKRPQLRGKRPPCWGGISERSWGGRAAVRQLEGHDTRSVPLPLRTSMICSDDRTERAMVEKMSSHSLAVIFLARRSRPSW